MLNICLTFDYELFFGENYVSEEEVLFAPTKKLLNILQKEEVSATFFVDIYSYIRHLELGILDYSRLFAEQLQSMIDLNQDVQLHIHPHWIYSDYVDGRWKFDPSHYSLDDFQCGDENINTEKIVQNSIRALKEILGTNYQCVAFRAGGLSMQPENEVIQLLIDNGILIDSSIAPRMKTVAYNFKGTPHKLNWKISPKYGIRTDAKSEEDFVLEVPVATIRNNIFRFLRVGLENLRIPSSKPKGSFYTSNKAVKSNKWHETVDTFCRRIAGYSMLSLDTKGYKLLKKELDSIYAEYRCDRYDAAISIICHPKMLTGDSLENIQNFIRMISEDQKRYKFTNMKGITGTVIMPRIEG